jgi:hypothetical protein
MNSEVQQAAVAPPASRRIVACAIAGSAVLGAWWLHGHPPMESSFYPTCYFHALTGLHCPGCGATRAVYALLHGHLTEALHQNVLAVCALPFIGVAASKALWRWTHRLPPPPRNVNGRWSLRLTLLLAPLVVLFGIVRNLPWHPFTLLAPY